MQKRNENTTSAVSKPLLEYKKNTIVNNAKYDDENIALKNIQIDNEMKRIKSVSIMEETNKKETKKSKMVPPDGGWGWLVLFGSTLVNVLVPGTIKSFGVLFVEFLEAFQATTSAGMWIPALCYFLYSSLGPVSSLLSLRYSYRSVTLVGGTFAALGMILSFWANSVTFLYVTYGIFVGIGAGLSFPPTVYIVTSYFVRLRGVANGICISGSALGSIILPAILRIILTEYGYRGACLIMGGITLNVWVAALFYDPVEKHLKQVFISEDDINKDKNDPDETDPLQTKFIISQEDSMTSLPQIPYNDAFLENLDNTTGNFNRSLSSATFHSLKSQIQHQKRERKISMPTGKTEVIRAKAGTGSSRSAINSSSALHAVPERSNVVGAMDVFSQSRLPNSRRKRVGPPKRSPSTSSFQYVSTAYHGSTLTLQPEIFASSFSLRSNRRVCIDGEKEDQPKKNKFFDITLLQDPIYLIILLSNATNAISYTNFVILLPSYAQNLGYNKNMGALLLSIVSAADLIGRIGGSALSDLTRFPKYWYFIGGLCFSGISLALMPLFKDYYMVAIFCSVFGLASGTYVGITAVIMADMLGEERLQSTYGISLFVNGVLQLVGPPICGVWFEYSKNFNSLFTSLGIILLLGTSIWGFLPCIKDRDIQSDNTGEKP